MIKKILFAMVSIVVLLFVGSLFYAAFRPKPHSFFYSLSLISTEPYGCSILKSQLPNFFEDKNVRSIGSLDLKPYYPYVVQNNNYGHQEADEFDSTWLEEDVDFLKVEKFNFLGISKNLILSQIDVNSLWLHLYQGNEALLLADHLGTEIREALGVTTEDYTALDSNELSKAFSINYKNGKFYEHKSYTSYSAIVEYPEDAEVICTNKLGDVIGISLKIGNGRISYFSMPVIFSNLHLLKDRRDFAEIILKTLPVENTFYAQYTGGRADNYTQQPGIMSFIHSQASLAWAFYTLLFSILLFMAFRIRRMQRIIPIVNPPPNSSLQYVESLSNLYLLHKNHRETAIKKMNYFLNRIRLEYHLNTNEANDQFYLRLSQKSGVDQQIVKQLFIKYHYINATQEVSSEEFQAFCELLQHFKN